MDLYFQNWSSSGTDPLISTQHSAQPIIFRQSGAIVTANYKAQKASNTSNWVQSNMVNFKGDNNVAYKSMNQLWLHMEGDDISESVELLIYNGVPLNYSICQDKFSGARYIGYMKPGGEYMVKAFDAYGDVFNEWSLGTLSTSITPTFLQAL